MENTSLDEVVPARLPMELLRLEKWSLDGSAHVVMAFRAIFALQSFPGRAEVLKSLSGRYLV